MKTNDQLLLRYMYEAGYTEEEMFDTAKITKAGNSIGFFFFNLRLSTKGLINRIVSAFDQFKETVKDIWSGIKSQVTYLDEYWEVPSRKNNSIPLIDFRKRSSIQHQVLTRKPNHLIRKIIR
ncbi:hypothetical protein [Planococcus versutus]|uniref:Uncharacterized protein n=1 Tax=Planococcus versutus TaxID=1302659 RepID=A0A1B1S5I6_9BACL|nr:hypothetical protein [Planococcus versutus]ANU28441.1 hypothetical protein I858_015735 [Planococcus versutus]